MRIRLLLIIALLPACAPPPDLRIEDPWVRAPVPGQTVSAGYLVLVNDRDSDLTLETVTSPDVERIEVHTHLHDGDMMRMRRLDRLTVPAQSRVIFAPGGHHLMVFGAAAEVDALTLVFGFADGTKLAGTFEVRGLARPERATPPE